MAPRRALKVLAGLALLACVIALAGPVTRALAQDDDKGFLVNLIQKNLSSAGRTVSIDGFKGALSSQASLDQMTIADDDGVWLTVKDVVLDWNRSALLRGRVEVTELSAGEIIVARPPKPGPAAGPSPEAKPFSLPELPVSVNIAKLTAARVALGQPVLGQAAELSVAGSVSLAGGDGAANLAIERTDGTKGVYKLDASYVKDSGAVKLDLAVDEAEGGIVTTLAKLPGAPAVTLTAQGAGPLDDLAIDIRLSTAGQDRLAGQVTLLASEEGGTTLRSFRADLAGDLAPLFAPDYGAFFGNDVRIAAAGAQTPGGGFALSSLDLHARALDLTGRVTVGADGLPTLMDVSGTVAADDGSPVLLPLAGARTLVDRVALEVAFDAAQGPDWTMSADIAGLDRPDVAAGTLRLAGTGQIAKPGGTPNVNADLTFTATGLAPAAPAVAEALGTDVSGTATVAWAGGGPVSIKALKLDGADYGLTGVFDIDGIGSDLKVAGNAAVRADDLKRFRALAGRPLAGAATVAVTGSAEALSGGFDADATVTGTGIAIGQPQVDSLLAGQSTVAVSMKRDTTGTTLRSLAINAATLTATASGSLSTGAADLTASLDFADLAALGAGYGGRLKADAQVKDGPGGQNVVFTADASDIRTGIAEVDGLLGGASKIDADVTRRGEAVTINRFALDAASLTATASGTYDPGSSDVSAKIDFADIGVLGPNYGGTFNADARVTEVPEGQRIVLTGLGRDIRIGVEQVDGLLAGDATIDAQATKSGSTIVIDRARINARTLTVTADGRYVPGASDITADLGFTDLAVLGPGYAGSLDANARLTEAGADQRIVLDAAGQDVAIGQPQVDGLLRGRSTVAANLLRSGATITIDAASARASTLTAQASGTYAPGASDVTATLDFADLKVLGPAYAGRLAATAHVTEAGPARHVVLDGSGTGLAVGQPQADRLLAGTSSVSADLTQTGSAIDIARATLRAATLSASAQGRYEAGASDLAASVDFGDLAVLGPGYGGSATATATLKETGSTRDVTVSAEAQNLAVGQPQANRLLAGTTTLTASGSQDGAAITISALDLKNPQLTATASGGQTAEGRTLTLDARLANLGLVVPQFPGPLSVTGTAEQAGDTYRLDLAAVGPGGIRADVKGALGTDFKTSDLAITGSAELALLNPFIAPRSVQAPVRFDLRMEGAPGLAGLSGTVAASNMRVAAPTLGLALQNGSVDVRLGGGRATVDANAAFSTGGRITVSGPVALAAPYDADLAIVLGGAVLQNPDLYKTSVDGRIAVTGPLTGGATIGGTLDLGETEIRVPSTGLGGAEAIPDGLVHRSESAAVRQTRVRAGLIAKPGSGGGSGGGRPFPLDITVNAPNRVFIRGRGLDAELGGSIQLGGTTSNIVPVGQFDLIRGRLELLGKRLDLTEGQARLQGEFVPYVRLVATTTAGDGVTVTITIEGDATEPTITFASSPELPQEEVVAQLLFGKGLQNLSILQAAQLASAVATLAGKGGEGIVGNLRQNFGLDDLDVTTDDQGNAGVRAGKYLSKNVYTDLSVGSDGKTKVSINLDLTSTLKAKGSIGSEGGSGVGLYYERDF